MQQNLPTLFSKFIVSLSLCLGHPSPAEETKPIEMVYFGSCIDQNHPVPILETIAKQNPDIFVFLGDNIYADTEDMKVMDAKYQLLGENKLFQKLTLNSEILATWDDHDFGAGDGGANYPKRVESEQLFLDFWKEPDDSQRRKHPGIYTAKIYGPVGKRVQIIVLDTRYFRSPLKGGEKRVGGSWKPDDDTDKTMLGAAQWKWLEDQLRQPAEIRIIASSIQLVAQDAGQETWSNLPRERQRLIDLIASTKAKGCFVISGDRHWSELSMTSEKAPYPLYDITSSSLNQKHPRGTPTENKYRISPTTWHHENYGVIEIDWDAKVPTITLGIHDVEGIEKFKHRIPLSELSRMAPD